MAKTTSTPQPPTGYSLAELERLERRMERRWYDLAMAEQRGQPTHALERMFDAYINALDAYVDYHKALSGGRMASRLAS